ncbi:acyl-CoA dehydrogenase family protein [Mycolicibacter hiberniae]|uniref:Acyl-CoA dehydrogenase n=1 Tax=Mycolicibacter hiberniae TaxID=29314 RepID=A0A7I7X0Y3_9MYCO|nr:acyl-CoA dehydrogenase family protein [Mycolicibacter hiberniae]MCV7084806.1 acyl-CoA dehydrogenase family protein [Mycolicibacter hiberniae]ORV71447.1 acyl-CoA dehydrogenase [Mycolicibacter hiberniae]BBZ23354.1 acyl-CoA dehydrogenase [Mycolicibacter hiberniae]
MTTTTAPELTDEFVSRLAQRAAAAEELRQLPAETVEDFRTSGLAGLLLPARYGGRQAEFPEILDPIRRMAHGCASSAWTLGFYMLHNWMLALFGEQAQDEVFAGGPVLCPAPLAPTGRGVPDGDGIRLSGRWSWATGVMECDWIMVGAICGPDDAPYPALVLLPATDIRVEDVWHTAGMRATGSNDVLIDDVFVPAHRLVKVVDIYSGTAPGADLHDASAYRWPMVPALALAAAMPALGSAEWVTDLFAERLTQRVLAYSGAAQKNQPAAQIRLGDARVRLRALRGLLDDTVGRIQDAVDARERISRSARADARAAAAHIVHESRAVIADLLEASGASAQFVTNPMQRAKRDVDVICGHVVFDYDVARELAGALEAGVKISPISMI